MYVHSCTLVSLPRDGREKLRLAAVSAIVFSPRPASMIGGFISRTKNPKISTLRFQNAPFLIHKSKDIDRAVNFMDTRKHVPLHGNNNLCQFRNLRFLFFFSASLSPSDSD
jgi:hypothetical protein